MKRRRRNYHVAGFEGFYGKDREDEALQARMGEIVKSSTQEDVFDNCNAVAAEMGYTIVEDDMRALADEYQDELSDEELDKVAGGSKALIEFIRNGTIKKGIEAGINIIRNIGEAFK